MSYKLFLSHSSKDEKVVNAFVSFMYKIGLTEKDIVCSSVPETKIAIGNEILEKPARLTDEEFAKMKNHAGYTYMILSKVDGFEEIRDIAAFHHERLDGSGYPFGKRADELTTLQRIMACADIYQALTEKRPYKDGMDHDKACEILKDMADKNWIDKNITEVICHTKEL